MQTHDNLNILFYDSKEISFIQEKPLDRIMAYFRDVNRVDLENSQYAKSIYRVFEWENYSSFDVINSFWTIYTCGLVIANELLIKENELRGNHYYEFSDNKKSVLLNKRYINKNIYAKTYFKREENSDFKKIVRKLQSQYSQINELASLCHAVINFAPCRDSSFNYAKGLCEDVKDFLPLMVDKVENCIQNSSDLEYKYYDKNRKIYVPVTVDTEILRKYKEWLIENREVCRLQGFYHIDDTGKMIGVPLFEGQSIESPLPTNEDELGSCLKNIIDRLYNRSKLFCNK